MTLLAREVKARAAELGFVACGITDLGPSPHAVAFDRWLRQGYGGNMRYLHRQAKKRKDTRLIDREAIRGVVILDNYYATEYQQPDGKAKIARYASSTDYHITTLKRVNALAELLTMHGAKTARPYVDTGPVPERELAQRAGLGWIGKNTMLLRPGLGSWFVIGTIFTDLPLELDSPFATDHCGSCTKCLDACPTRHSSSPTCSMRPNAFPTSPSSTRTRFPPNWPANSAVGRSDAMSATRCVPGISDSRPKPPCRSSGHGLT